MPDVTQDVQPDPSTGTVVDATAQVTSTEGEQAHPDRPVENAVAEFNRKFSKLQSQLDAAIQFMATQQTQVRQPQPVQAAPATTPSDEDLWALAQQGDRQAFEAYQRRIAQREIDQRLGVQQRTNVVTAQLQALTARYPVLNDATHPLTQKTQQAYQLLIANGYAAGPATLLEAAKTAIADSPDVVSELYTKSAQVREQGRQTAATRAQGGAMGASPRNVTPTRTQPRTITPEERTLARRMGLKTDAEILKAKERFLERNADGRSNLGAVGGYVNAEDL